MTKAESGQGEAGAFLEIRDALRTLSAGEISCDEAERKLAEIKWESVPEIAEVRFALEHYFSDVDVRGRDEEYREFQKAELEKLVMSLERGDMKAACRVTFLSAE